MRVMLHEELCKSSPYFIDIVFSIYQVRSPLPLKAIKNCCKPHITTKQHKITPRKLRKLRFLPLHESQLLYPHRSPSCTSSRIGHSPWHRSAQEFPEIQIDKFITHIYFCESENDNWNKPYPHVLPHYLLLANLFHLITVKLDATWTKKYRAT